MYILYKSLAFLAYARRIFLQLRDRKNFKHIHLVWKGFTPNKGNLYDFENNAYEGFVTDSTRYLKNVFINYKYQELFKDKYSNYLFLKEFTDKAVPVYGLIDKGRCFLVHKFKTMESLFESENKFVLKPRTGWGGKGVFILDIENEKALLNGNEISRSDIFSGLDNYVLVPFVQQHRYAENINPQALNTIRFLTCILDDEVQIIGSVHRFGSSTTGRVDNFSQGGISAKMNPDTGVIEAVYSFNPKTKKKCKTDVHPNTSALILGVEIPFWDIVKKEILELHTAIKFVKYIGWDIAITPVGYEIIESNHVSDVDGFQIHGPLMSNAVNKKFYQSN